MSSLLRAIESHFVGFEPSLPLSLYLSLSPSLSFSVSSPFSYYFPLFLWGIYIYKRCQIERLRVTITHWRAGVHFLTLKYTIGYKIIVTPPVLLHPYLLHQVNQLCNCSITSVVNVKSDKGGNRYLDDALKILCPFCSQHQIL